MSFCSKFIRTIVILLLFFAVSILGSSSTISFAVEEGRNLAVVPKDGVRRALLIGVSRYNDPHISALEGVNPDLELMCNQLGKLGFQEENITVVSLTEGLIPTKKNIETAVNEFLSKCGSKDFIFIMLGGHGFQSVDGKVNYFVPMDGELVYKDGNWDGVVASSCVSIDQLGKDLEKSAAKFKWLLIDACRVAYATRGKNEDEWQQLGNFEAPSGVLIFQSCSEKEQSLEGVYADQTEKHGLFTLKLVEAMDGKAMDAQGRVSVVDAFEYAKKEVVKASSRRQTPRYSCSEFTDFVLLDGLIPPEILKAQELADEALKLEIDGKYSESKRKIDSALALLDKCDGDYDQLGERRTEYEKIAQRLRGFIDKGKADDLVKLGEDYLSRGNNSSALSYAEQALQLDPGNKNATELKRNALAGLDLPEEYLDEFGQEFRLIPAGSFMMGNTMTPEEIHEKYPGGELKWYKDAPRHKVTLSRPYYIGKYAVTKGEFDKFVQETGYKTTAEKEGSAYTLTKEDGWKYVDGVNWRSPGFEQTSRHPAVCVSYDDALAYVSWLNKNAKPSKELNGQKPVYCLPTEAEWENAARAETRTEFFWGDEPKDGEGYLNAADESGTPIDTKWSVHFPFNDGYKATSPVGSFKPNPWGLYDMLGNVLEWCSDWYGDYETGTVVDPEGPSSGSSRVLRGGAWYGNPAYVRCARRLGDVPSSRSTRVGFRVAFHLTK